MTRALVIAAVVLAAAAGMLLRLLSNAHEALGRAELTARLNAGAVTALQEQEKRNQVLEARLEQLATARDVATRETVREIYIQPASDACRRSPAMRALDGRLRHQPGGDGDRPAAAAAPAHAVPPPGGPPR